MALKNAIYASILKTENAFDKLTDSAATLSKFLLSTDCSEAVQRELFKCLARSSINSEKITEDSFEGYFEDYADCLIACIELNVLPFAKGLLSLASTLGPVNQPEGHTK